MQSPVSPVALTNISDKAQYKDYTGRNLPSQFDLYRVLSETSRTGAKEGIIGIKEKHKSEIDLLNSKIGRGIRVIPLEDVYPAGDEITLIYMTTGRIVQPGELPISVGCVVQNVETLFNIVVQ